VVRAAATWRHEGDALVREIQTRDFDTAFQIVARVASAAQDHFRRPDLCISEFNHVRITVTNPHHAGITEAEHRLTKKVDAALGDG
jgi:pterin-4a-carbinolamine dehydratase